MWAGQLFRFVRQFKIGDRVVTYDPASRLYYCGQIAGEYEYHSDVEFEEMLNRRRVRWEHERKKDDLSDSAQNSLGAISTIFRIPDPVSAELWNESWSTGAAVEEILPEQEAVSLSAMGFAQVASAAQEAISDRLAALGPYQMQELVAGLLRAMGYKTTVSKPGSDRGRDIVASPDGFGFQDPRIVVEVKHRPGERIGAPDIRSFLGGRHPADKGLYVSTGGFTNEARYEAERANIPLTLIDFEGLIEAVREYYDRFDEESRQMFGLRTILWPAD
jgi:restriction system protein